MHIEASANVAGLVLHFRTDMQTMECVRSMVDEGIRIVVISVQINGGVLTRTAAVING